MHSYFRVAPVVALWLTLSACAAASTPIVSEIIDMDAGDRVVLQTVEVEAPIDEVWKAYSTSEGWMGWAAPVAEVDLKVGGRILTNYTPGAKIGDPGTNTLYIRSYVPERLLVLQAELSDNWPEIMKEDADNLMNVIVFEDRVEGRTRILSYGVGYRALPAYDDLLEFFVPANEGLYGKLKARLESK